MVKVSDTKATNSRLVALYHDSAPLNQCERYSTGNYTFDSGHCYTKMTPIVSFWFSFVDCVLVYRYTYVFVRLCLDVHVVHVVLLHIEYDSCYVVSSTHWVAPQHTLGPPML